MATNQILSGQARMIRPGEMVLDPGPRSPINIDTRSAVAAVEADGNAFARADMGRAKIGEAVGDLGDNLSKLALAQMEAINITKRAEAQNAMTEGEAEMQAAMVKEPDELKYESIATAYAAKTRERIDKMALSPVAKAAVDSDFSRWQIHRTGQAKIESAKQSIAKATGAINDRIKLAKLTQDYSMLTDALTGAGNLGIVSKDGKKLHEVDFTDTGKKLAAEAESEQRKADREDLSGLMLDNPFEALAKLEAKSGEKFTHYQNMDATDRLNSIDDAKQQVRRHQADHVGGEGGIRDRIVSGLMNPADKEPITEQQIIDAGEALQLGDEEIQNLIGFRKELAQKKAAKEPLDRKGVATLISEIEAYNGNSQTDPGAVKWGDMVRRAELLTAAGEKEGTLTRGVLMQKLYMRNPYAERSTDKEMPEGMEKKFNAYLSAYRKDNTLGVPEYLPVPKTEVVDGKIQPVAGQFEIQPNIAAATRFIELQSDLWVQLKAEYKEDRLKFQEYGALEAWVNSKLKGVKAGGLVDKLNAESATPPGLMPGSTAPSPGTYPGDNELEDFLNPTLPQ